MLGQWLREAAEKREKEEVLDSELMEKVAAFAAKAEQELKDKVAARTEQEKEEAAWN